MKTVQVITFILAIVFVSSITAETKNTEQLPIIVLNNTAEEPLSTASGDGFLDVLLRSLFKKVGYKLVVEKLPAERALRSANAGLIDGEMLRVAGMQKIYPNLIAVPESTIVWKFAAFSKKKIDLQQGWKALENKEVAYITGWKIYEIKVPKSANITKTVNSEELFNLLKKDRIDLVLFSNWAGIFMIDKLQIKNAKILLPFLAEKNMYIYLHKKHKSLVPKIAAELALMKKDGRYQKLVEKHLLSFR